MILDSRQTHIDTVQYLYLCHPHVLTTGTENTLLTCWCCKSNYRSHLSSIVALWQYEKLHADRSWEDGVMFNVMVHGLHGLFLGFDGREINRFIHSVPPFLSKIKSHTTFKCHQQTRSRIRKIDDGDRSMTTRISRNKFYQSHTKLQPPFCITGYVGFQEDTLYTLARDESQSVSQSSLKRK